MIRADIFETDFFGSFESSEFSRGYSEVERVRGLVCLPLEGTSDFHNVNQPMAEAEQNKWWA